MAKGSKYNGRKLSCRCKGTLVAVIVALNEWYNWVDKTGIYAHHCIYYSNHTEYGSETKTRNELKELIALIVPKTVTLMLSVVKATLKILSQWGWAWAYLIQGLAAFGRPLGNVTAFPRIANMMYKLTTIAFISKYLKHHGSISSPNTQVYKDITTKHLIHQSHLVPLLPIAHIHHHYVFC